MAKPQPQGKEEREISENTNPPKNTQKQWQKGWGEEEGENISGYLFILKFLNFLRKLKDWLVSEHCKIQAGVCSTLTPALNRLTMGEGRMKTKDAVYYRHSIDARMNGLQGSLFTKE